MSVHIRRCERRDLPAVRELMRQLEEVAPTNTDFRLDKLEATLAEMEQLPAIYLNLVAVAEGRVVGFASAIFYKTLFHEGGTALINELVVDRTVRGAGIGSRLVEEIKREAMARGMEELEVGTEQSNILAQRFYRRRGFDKEYVLLGMEF